MVFVIQKLCFCYVVDTRSHFIRPPHTSAVKEMLICSSLMKLLANPLSQQAGKWLVIRRRPESSALIKIGFRFCKNNKIE
ncbi:MAG: hypothetical protein COW45_02480 [Gallionellales bacterium CG17_big_fil_post_rev_8_21_14_2_50_54_146]|nr:MAG: hypothetical protein COW45_02480 [Gallionellales bacterium CG17_big_fil_post_rev_8_21_14_2_50_54_146]